MYDEGLVTEFVHQRYHTLLPVSTLGPIGTHSPALVSRDAVPVLSCSLHVLKPSLYAWNTTTPHSQYLEAQALLTDSVPVFSHA